MGDGLEYWAFLSYSHADKGWAKWLHRALETYTVPRHLIGRTTLGGEIPKKIQPIFRDRDELPASTNLSATVRSALQKSRYLIVLCSPEAAQSKWVNQEILEFKAARGAENIICAIVGRAPSDTEHSTDPSAGFFPAAIMMGDETAEPLAADLRRGCDGKRLGKLKIIAGLLGTGLDELVQRDTRRRQRRLTAVTAASLSGMVVMIALTILALDARQDAERSRADAEGLIEFMLGDLRAKLEPVGRLDVLDGLGERVLTYYAAQKTEELDADSLGRRSRALHLLGEIDDLRGNLDQARLVFEEANQTTAELLARMPDDPQRLFNHAQSVYWLGYIEWQRGRSEKAEAAFLEYQALAEQLLRTDPGNAEWQAEVGYASSNLGTLLLEQGRLPEAVEAFRVARNVGRNIAERDPESVSRLWDLAQANAWLSTAQERLGHLDDALEKREAEVAIYQMIREKDPNNKTVSESLLVAERVLGRLSMSRGNLPEALTHLERAVDLADTLLDLNPENTRWAQFGGLAYLDFGEVLLSQGDSASAKEAIAVASGIAEDLLVRDPDVLRWQVNLRARSRLLEALLARESADYPLALQICQEVAGLLNLQQKDHPANEDILWLLGYSNFVIGELLFRLGRHDEALDAWRGVVSLLDPNQAILRLRARMILAQAFFRLGRASETAQLVAEFERINYRHPDFVEFQKISAMSPGSNN